MESNPLSLNIARLRGGLVMDRLWPQGCSVAFEARLGRHSSFPLAPLLGALALGLLGLETSLG